MRVAVLSDIHGNLTAFEAVLADLRLVSPDLVLHGGDLADSGSSLIEIVDRIRDLGWQGVMGNADEMLVRPNSLEDFARQSSAPPSLWAALREIAAVTRSLLDGERLAWLRQLPNAIAQLGFALVHATPESCWKVPAPDATDSELDGMYGSLGKPIVIYGHTHCPEIRRMSGSVRLLINTGSVGMPLDDDPRASYLVLDDGMPCSGLPGAEWTRKILRSSSPQMP